MHLSLRVFAPQCLVARQYTPNTSIAVDTRSLINSNPNGASTFNTRATAATSHRTPECTRAVTYPITS